MGKSFKQLFEKARKRPEYWLASLELEITERICKSRKLKPYRKYLFRLITEAVKEVERKVK